MKAPTLDQFLAGIILTLNTHVSSLVTHVSLSYAFHLLAVGV